MTIIENFGGKWNTVDAVQTERGARTIAVDPKTHRIYLLGADYGSPSGKSGEKQGRPTVLPDTFHVLVVGKYAHARRARFRQGRSIRVETSDFAMRLSRTYRQPNTRVEPSSRVNAAQAGSDTYVGRNQHAPHSLSIV